MRLNLQMIQVTPVQWDFMLYQIIFWFGFLLLEKRILKLIYLNMMILISLIG